MDLDDDFFDDGFDDVTETVLEELEKQAIQLTQHQSRAVDVQKAQDEFGWDDDVDVGEDDDLDTTEVFDHAAPPLVRPSLGNSLPSRNSGAGTSVNAAPTLRQTSRPPPPIPNPRWNPAIDPASRPPVTAGATANRPQPSQFARPAVPLNRLAPSQASQASSRGPQGPSGDIVVALQNRIRALEEELNGARGEISIIRSNSSRAQQQHDAEVARLRKVHAENQAKQGRLVEAAVAAEKTASTELQFLQRDAREVNDRTRRQNSGSSFPAGSKGAPTTPSKNHKTWGVADGFDDLDMAVSPSKGRSRPVGPIAPHMGERTPNRGKRKRTQLDSPVKALDVSAGEDIKMVDRTVPRPATPSVIVSPPALPYEYLQLVLDHGCGPERPPTFDLFSHYFLPSEPGLSFAAMIFSKLPLMGSPGRPMQLLVDFSEFLVFLWSRCLDEDYWEPIRHIVALLVFTFQLNTSSVAPLVVASLAAAARRTIYTLAEARHRLPGGDLTKDPRYNLWEQQVDSAQVLMLLYSSALACATTTVETDIGSFESKAVDFWKLLPLDFVLLLLTPKQRFSDALGMLYLLRTSSLPRSLGPITDDKEPPFIARVVIERVSAKLLSEKSPIALTTREKLKVRLTALQTLIAFARHDFGAYQLATHSNALPRLVTCLSASIDELYDQPVYLPVPDQFRDEENEPSAGAAVAFSDVPFCVLNQIISLSVHLIHTLVTGLKTANDVDISQKLAGSHGGSQRYLIALGRLTFAEEDLVLEAGIESEVVEMANELLEMAVTPDEGEIIGEAFGA